MAADTLDTFLIEVCRDAQCWLMIYSLLNPPPCAQGDCSDFQEVFKQEVKTQVSDIKFLTIYHCYLENADLDRIQQAIKWQPMEGVVALGQEMGLRCPVYYS
eukprot:1914720-Rhodomonas_salina.3